MRLRAAMWTMMLATMVVAIALTLPVQTYAQTPPPLASLPSECDGYVGLTHHIAGCIRVTIDKSAQAFFTGIYPALRTAIGGILTLAIVVYGVMLSFGLVEKVGRDTFVLLLKIAAISYFVTSSPFMFRTIIGAMDGAAGAVVSYTPPSGMADNAGSDYSQGVCMRLMVEEQAKADKSKPIITPWLGIDCLIDSVIGIKVPPELAASKTGTEKWFNDLYEGTKSGTPNSGMSRALLYFFFSSMQSSILGAVLAVVGFFFIYGLLMLIIRAFFGYIAGYIGVAFLIILSPLFIPLMLFRETKQYFDKWVKLLIGFALQPVIMLVFIIFSLTAVDLAAFSGNYSIMYQIAGDASRTKPFSLNEYLTTQRNKAGEPDTSNPPCADCGPIILKKGRELAKEKVTPAKADAKTVVPIESRDLGGVVDDLAKSACTEENIKADEAKAGTTHALKKYCDAQRPIRAMFNTIDWDKMAAAHKPGITAAAGTTPGQQIARQIMAAVFFCCMVVFILNGMLAIVPSIALDLVGDIAQSPDLNGLFSGNLGGRRSAGASGVASALSTAGSNAIRGVTAPFRGAK